MLSKVLILMLNFNNNNYKNLLTKVLQTRFKQEYRIYFIMKKIKVNKQSHI